MSLRRFIDSNGEQSVEQSFDLPLSKIEYLKYLPHLSIALGAICGTTVACFVLLCHIYKRLGILIDLGGLK